MDQILNQLTTVGVCAGIMSLCYFVWLTSGAFGVKYSDDRTWSWKVFREDFLKLLLRSLSMVGYVVASNLLEWLFGRLNMDVGILADAASTIFVLRLMIMASVDYMSRAGKNYQKFFDERHSEAPEIELDATKIDYSGIAQDVKDTISTIYSSINVQHDSDNVKAGTTLTKKRITELAEMGAISYYKVDTSTPQKAYQSLIGKGFDEGWGLQCVAGFKEFMFSLAGRYVAAGGAASGYAYEPARSAVCKLGFTWHAGTNGLQDGDWGIWTNGLYGHVAMYYQGKWLGQNQGAADGNAGNAFNLMALPMQGFAGYFRPNIYARLAVGSDIDVLTRNEETSGHYPDIKVGDLVQVLKYVDFHGIKLMNLQSTPYLVIQVRKSDRTAVLQSDDGDTYARMSWDDIKKVN